MVEDDKMAPLFEELYGKRFNGSKPAAAVTLGAEIATPVHLVSDTARAVSTEVFYPHTERRPVSFLGKSANVAIACAAILAATAAIGSYLAPSSNAAPTAMPASNDAPSAAPVTASGAAPDSGQPVQILAISKVPAAAMQPVAAVAKEFAPQDAPASGFVRIAQNDAPGLNVTNVFGQGGTPIRIPITLSGAKPEDYSFLMFRGLPANVTLSSGFRLKESWAVSLRDLGNLSLETPADYQGRFNLEVLLIKGRDTPAESRLVTVEILSRDLQVPAFTARAQPAPGPQVLTAAPRGPEPEQSAALGRPGPAPGAARAAPAIPQEDAMIARATTLLDRNDVASARLLFEHLARQGSARAALAMAKTFDPAFLRTIEAAGLEPDVEKAREWYRRAADLGNQEAATALSSLTQ